MKFDIELSKDASEHLMPFSARERKTLLDAIEEQLTFEPEVPTKKRKEMRQNPLAAWELKVGNFRVYYKVFTEPVALVVVAAIGIKERNKIYIGGEEISL
jgi:mRNA-degrading endonuclease RelE of RelBE toxin-antitoxin system